MNLKAQLGNFEYTSPLKFGTVLSYFTDHPKEAMKVENYFLNCQNMLYAGDEILVSCLDSSDPRKCLGWDKAVFEVVSSKLSGVVVELIGEWRRGGMKHEAMKVTVRAVDPPILRFVPEDCEAVHKVARIFNIVGIKSGKIYASVMGKEQAQAVARGDEPLPITEA